MWGRYWSSVSASLLERLLLVFASPCGLPGSILNFRIGSVSSIRARLIAATLSREPTNPPFFLRGGFVSGFLPIFFAQNIGKTPKTKNGGYENGGLLTLESPLNTPPFFLRGGFWFGVFAYFFCPKYRKNTPSKKRGLRKRGFVDSRPCLPTPFPIPRASRWAPSVSPTDPECSSNRHFSSPRGVHGVVNFGGRSKNTTA